MPSVSSFAVPAASSRPARWPGRSVMGSGLPMPSRRTFVSALQASTHCMSAALRHPGCACSHSPLEGTGSPSQPLVAQVFNLCVLSVRIERTASTLSTDSWSLVNHSMEAAGSVRGWRASAILPLASQLVPTPPPALAHTARRATARPDGRRSLPGCTGHESGASVKPLSV